MKIKLLSALTAAILLLVPKEGFGQAPSLGAAAKFVLFTTIGPVTNSGIPQRSHITGYVGTNAGSTTGFGNVDGQVHDGGDTTIACATDVLLLLGQLTGAPTTISPTSTLLGNGDTLVAGVYQYPLLSAASLNLNIILDGEGDPNALFIIRIDGAFSVNPGAKVILANGALACNVFWLVQGMIGVGAGATLRGTILANNGQIALGALDTVEGRVFSINGEILTNSLMAHVPLGCGGPFLTGPAAPPLASAAAFGVFSSIGPVTSTPVTYIIGDVGSNSALPTGFNVSNVTGAIRGPGSITGACASDLTIAYNYLNALHTDVELLAPALFGYDLVLTPHTYHMAAAPITLTGNVYLDGQGNPNAVFVINMNGAFITSTNSKIILMNGTQAKNVYWKIDGATHIYDFSVFNGTIIGAGAINMNLGDTLNGRALTINDAVAINGTYINNISQPCTASPMTGTMQVCLGATTTLSNVDTGGRWQSSNPAVATVGFVSGIVSGITAGTSIITFTSGLSCETTDTITVDSSPFAGTITGTATVCPTTTATLSNTAGSGTWTSVNTAAAIIGSASGIVTGVAAGTSTISYTVTNSCGTVAATRVVTTNAYPNAGVITGTAIACPATTTTLSNAAGSGIWTSLNMATATIGPASGIVTGLTPGTTTISYTVTNSCGIAAATRIVTIDPSPNAGVITGIATVCPANTTTLSNTTGSGVWTSVNTATATIGTASGIVTGVAAGTTTISYTVTNSCGTVAATRTVTVDPMPDAGSIAGPSSVCVGSAITLSNTASGGIWSSSNSNASVSSSGTVTGINAGVSNISYTVAGPCGVATATKPIAINALPNAGSITGASSVCVGGINTLTNTVTGGTWSSSNSRATVSAGMVIGAAPGIDTIVYTVTNICGPATTIKIITINSLPSVPVITTQAPVNVCAGTMYQNYGTTTPAVAGTVYSWTAVNASVWAQGAAHNNAVVSFMTPGNAYVILNSTISATDCSSQSTIAVSVSADEAPISYVSYFSGHFVCTPNNVNAYQWGYDDKLTLDSTILPGEINMDYVNQAPDLENKHYWVMTTSGSCHQKTYYRTPLAIQATDNTTVSVNVYPNPATSVVNVELSTVIHEMAVVKIWNVLGQNTNTVSMTGNKIAIDIADLPAGSYIIACFIGGARISNTRFVKN